MGGGAADVGADGGVGFGAADYGDADFGDADFGDADYGDAVAVYYLAGQNVEFALVVLVHWDYCGRPIV